MRNILVARIIESVLGTSTPAVVEPLTFPADLFQVRFPPTELILFVRIQQIDETVFMEVAQFPARLDEEIAGVDISVVLDRDIHAALVHEGTVGWRVPHVDMKKRIKEANGGGGSTVVEIGSPEVEYLAEESSKLTRCYGERGRCAGIIRVRFHARDELHESESGLLVEVVDFFGKPGGIVVYHRQCVHVDASVKQHSGVLVDLFPRGAPVTQAPVVVVNVFRPVDRKSDQEIVFLEEPGPLPIQQQPVGLKSIADLATTAVAVLVCYRTSVKIQPHERRFAALPPEMHGLIALHHDLLDHLPEGFVAHAMGFRFGEDRLLFQIEAIPACHVAVGARWFDKDVPEGLSVFAGFLVLEDAARQKRFQHVAHFKPNLRAGFQRVDKAFHLRILALLREFLDNACLYGIQGSRARIAFFVHLGDMEPEGGAEDVAYLTRFHLENHVFKLGNHLAPRKPSQVAHAVGTIGVLSGELLERFSGIHGFLDLADFHLSLHRVLPPVGVLHDMRGMDLFGFDKLVLIVPVVCGNIGVGRRLGLVLEPIHQPPNAKLFLQFTFYSRDILLRYSQSLEEGRVILVFRFQFFVRLGDLLRGNRLLVRGCMLLNQCPFDNIFPGPVQQLALAPLDNHLPECLFVLRAHSLHFVDNTPVFKLFSVYPKRHNRHPLSISDTIAVAAKCIFHGVGYYPHASASAGKPLH